KHSRHRLNEDDLARTGVYNGRTWNSEYLTRGRIREDSRFQNHAAARRADRAWLLGRNLRMHGAPPADALISGDWSGLTHLSVKRTTAGLDGQIIRMIGTDINGSRFLGSKRGRISRHRTEWLEFGYWYFDADDRDHASAQIVRRIRDDNRG